MSNLKMTLLSSQLSCFLWFVASFVIGYSGVAIASTDVVEKNSTRSVDDFLTSLTGMIGTVLYSDARYSQLLGSDDNGSSQSIISGRPNNRPPAADYFDTGRPPFLNRIPPQNFRPYPPSPYLENGVGGPYPSPVGPYPRPQYARPGFLGGRPPYLGPSRYPEQNSILQALSSISQHDDLRCVPRLLCEVSSGARPSSGYYQPSGYYQQQQQQQQQSTIPFLTKDALITLLTVLNFVDDSPLLMFGRAALLGYNARGDTRSCINAYPTCPRDSDQLINYLNNHNGGFFRFFNQQLPQYAPQYGPYQPSPPPPPHLPPPYRPAAPPFRPESLPFRPESPPFRPGNSGFYRPQPVPHQPLNPAQLYYAPQYQKPQYQQPQQQFATGFKTRSDDSQKNARILNGSPGQYFDVPSVQDLELDVPARLPMTFPQDDDAYQSATGAHFVRPLNLKFKFPSDNQPNYNAVVDGSDGGVRQGKKVKMVFPDRTGTGGLRADLDQYGNYKGVYYADGTIKFVDDHYRGDGGNRRPSKIRLPTVEGYYDNRLPYEKRLKLQFPSSAA